VPLRGKRLLIIEENEELGRLVAAAASALGASPVVRRGGRAALAELDASGADGAIVDLPLPDVRGDAFLIALRDRGVPCVAVSGVLRGARYAAEAKRFGAAGFLEKPFKVEEALALLANAIPGGVQPEQSPTPTPTATASSIATALAEVTQYLTPAPIRTPAPPATATPTEAPTPTAAATPSPDDLASDANADFDSLIFSSARPALDETLPGLPLRPSPAEGLAMPLPSAAAPEPRRSLALPSLPDGDLAATRVPRLLAALHVAQVTGALTLTRGLLKKLVLFEQGRPVFAISNVPAERFGARCLREGLISRDELELFLAEIGPKTALGEVLVARGLLTAEHRTRMVADQIREILWSTMSWRDGAYRLLVGPSARRAIVRVELRTGDVVLEGLRRTATLEDLRQDLPGSLALAPAADPAFELYDLALSKGEAAMLAHADGTKTAADLVVLSGMPERDALAFLLGCREIGVLDEVSRVLSGTRRIGFM
jgi:CheY-like chemotaxis protein